MQSTSGDVWGTIIEAALDSALVGACCAYAAWLDANKGLEPDHTYAEVTFGVALCLLQAELRARWTAVSYRRAVWRAFALGGTPVIAGELHQWRRRLKDRKDYERRRYRDLMQ